MTSTDEEELYEQKKYYAARFAWRRRGRRTPNKRIWWENWFEKMFGEELEDYARRKAKDKANK